MSALFSVAPSLDALGGTDPVTEATDDIGRGITAISSARRLLVHAAERLPHLSPRQADAIRELRRRLRVEDVKLGAILKMSDPFGLDEPIDAALILEAHAPAGPARLAAE